MVGVVVAVLLAAALSDHHDGSRRLLSSSLEVLPNNTVYRVGDLTQHTGIKWRTDSLELLANPQYRDSLLWDWLSRTSKIKGRKISSLNGSSMDTILQRARAEDTLLIGEKGPSGIVLEPSQKVRVAMLRDIVLKWVAEKRCEKAPSRTFVQHVRLGDRVIMLNTKELEMYKKNLFRSMSRLACPADSDEVQPISLNGVAHFGPLSEEVFARFGEKKWLRNAQAKYAFTQEKKQVNEQFVRTLKNNLSRCGVKYSWRSKPSIDDDVCYMVSAAAFEGSFGGFSRIIQQLRAGMPVRRINTECRTRLQKCFGVS